MTKEKMVEASITVPGGTQISIKGTKADVLEIATFLSSGKDGKSGESQKSEWGKVSSRDLSGIAEVEDGNCHILVQDLKAKNTIDAARRLIYVTLLVRKVLLNEPKSRRNYINEVLKGYNLYDGNTRNIIPKDRALVKEGKKFVRLSNTAVPTAWEYVREIKDTTVKGAWVPTKVNRRRRRKKTKKE